MADKLHFFTIIRPKRKDFLINYTEEDTKIMSEHFQYLKILLEEKKLFLAGPTLIEDDPFGVIIFETESENEARALIEKDPSVVAGIQEIDDFRPMRLSLSR